MRKTIRALALVLALSSITHAGEVQCPVVPPPPPQQLAAPGEIHTPPLVELALMLLALV